MSRYVARRIRLIQRGCLTSLAVAPRPFQIDARCPNMVLTNGLSRMRGDSHVRYLGAAAQQCAVATRHWCERSVGLVHSLVGAAANMAHVTRVALHGGETYVPSDTVTSVRPNEWSILIGKSSGRLLRGRAVTGLTAKAACHTKSSTGSNTPTPGSFQVGANVSGAQGAFQSSQDSVPWTGKVHGAVVLRGGR